MISWRCNYSATSDFSWMLCSHGLCIIRCILDTLSFYSSSYINFAPSNFMLVSQSLCSLTLCDHVFSLCSLWLCTTHKVWLFWAVSRQVGHWMRLIGLYLGTKYEVCRWNSIQDMASSLGFYPFWENLTLTWDLLGQGHRHLSCIIIANYLDFGQFLDIDLDLWILPQVKVISFWVIGLLGCIFVPSMKSVGQKSSEIWTQIYPISTLTAFHDTFGPKNSNFKYITKILLICFTIIPNLKWIGQTVWKLFGIDIFLR